ncbi:MAG: hypothetical protein OIN86_04695 [Candidatus Methanoperedens sp.]|nr:hypothetical protein [Candidatus Methanoperedens sp.]CAG0996837.1 hypothetical protein METP1_02622 [Methanosarcinales archaeon]
MKSNILSIILIILILSTTANAKTQVSKEFVTGQYGKFACAFGIGDCIYLITYDDGSTLYKLDRSILSTSSIVDSKSQLTATANIGQSASITYTVKGSGADGFNAHNQKYEWYDNNQNFMDVQSINIPYDKEYLWIHRVGPFSSSGTYEYSIIEWIEINIVNQNCLHLPCSPEYKQVWAKADEFYPRVTVSGGQTQTPVPTNPVYTYVQPTYPTYTTQPTYVQPTYPGYTSQPTYVQPPTSQPTLPPTPPGTGSTPSFIESNMVYIAIALILGIVVIALWPTENKKGKRR